MKPFLFPIQRSDLSFIHVGILEPLFEQRPLDGQRNGQRVLRDGGLHHLHRLLHRRPHHHHHEEREHDQVRSAKDHQLRLLPVRQFQQLSVTAKKFDRFITLDTFFVSTYKTFKLFCLIARFLDFRCVYRTVGVIERIFLSKNKVSPFCHEEEIRTHADKDSECPKNGADPTGR